MASTQRLLAIMPVAPEKSCHAVARHRTSRRSCQLYLIKTGSWVLACKNCGEAFGYSPIPEALADCYHAAADLLAIKTYKLHEP
jgi:hypothetical protein